MRNARHNLNNYLRSGFSLIEIMVAVTLLAVITVGLLSMFYHTQKAFRLGAGQVDTLEAGRATIQLLSQELQEVYPSHINTVGNFAAIPSTPTRLVMTLPGGGFRTNTLQDVSFLTRQGDEWVGITYRVHHNNRGAGSLYKAFVTNNPNAALPQLQTAVVENLYTNASGIVPDITNHIAPVFHRVADGVVHLRVRPYDDRGLLLGTGAYTFTNGVSSYTYETNTLADWYAFTNGVPAFVDLELAILDPKGVSQFGTRLAPADAWTYLEGQAHRVQLFTKRIPVRAHRSEFDLFVVK